MARHDHKSPNSLGVARWQLKATFRKERLLISKNYVFYSWVAQTHRSFLQYRFPKFPSRYLTLQ